MLAPRLEQRILPGLERMERALGALGHPERAFTSVLVLGTNGKGSTAALLAGILAAHGAAVGLYTSPHLVAIEERIRVRGVTIAPARLAELAAALARFPELSFFETLTCAALLEFAARRIDIAVMEAGLGGRWDASRAAGAAVSLLTNIGTDHQKWLGSTRAEIAAEKAAALSGHEAVVGAWDDEVEPVIRAGAAPGTPVTLASSWATVQLDVASAQAPSAQRSRGAEEQRSASPASSPLPLCSSAPRPSARELRPGPNRVRFTVGAVSGEAELPLAGAHQLGNLALALAGAAALARHGLAPALDAAAVRRGVEGVRWPGRLQWSAVDGHRLLLDGAHNLEAAAVLAAALDAMGLSGRIHLLFSCLDDKPLAAMAALLRPRVTGVTVAPLASPRATDVAALAAAFPGCRVAASVAAALPELPDDRPTLATGSLRLVGEVLDAAGGEHG